MFSPASNFKILATFLIIKVLSHQYYKQIIKDLSRKCNTEEFCSLEGYEK